VTLWIDEPNLNDTTASVLLDVLADAYTDPAELKELWRRAGRELADFPLSGGSARLLWVTIVHDLTAAELKSLVMMVHAQMPRVRERLDVVLDTVLPEVNGYRPPDRFSTRLVGPRSTLALLDRADLRSALREITAEQNPYPLVSITGASRSGKSYSRHLIRHVADDPACRRKFVVLDIDREWPEENQRGWIGARDFMNRLAWRLRLAGWQDDEEQYTDTVRTAAELASKFVRLADWDDHRWIFVDGLDRKDVLPEVHDVIGFLAGHLADGQLGDGTRLIVTGHRGDFAPDVSDWMCEERLGPLDDSHLVEFFTEVARDFGSPLSEQDCAQLVAEVRAQAELCELESLSAVVGRIVRERFHLAGTR
jgi:hypothetical protein